MVLCVTAPCVSSPWDRLILILHMQQHVVSYTASRSVCPGNSSPKMATTSSQTLLSIVCVSTRVLTRLFSLSQSFFLFLDGGYILNVGSGHRKTGDSKTTHLVHFERWRVRVRMMILFLFLFVFPFSFVSDLDLCI